MPTVHPNYIKASNIVLLQLLIALANYLLYYNDIHIRHKILVPVVVIVFSGVMFYLLRIGTNWGKVFVTDKFYFS
jgi:hypothetical protein